jgi:hypothetical protein
MELLDFEGEKVGGIFEAECDRDFHRLQNKKNPFKPTHNQYKHKTHRSR